MTPGAYAFIALLVILFVAMLYVIWTSPDGYQDSDGFHYGPGVDEWEDGV